MPASKKRLLFIEQWDKANTTQVHLKLNLTSDADILRKLEEVKVLPGGKQGYIKALIRENINK